ncbi:hypothetical protein D3C75_915060 [compost metagenome]
MTPVSRPHSGPSQFSLRRPTRKAGRHNPLSAYSNNAAPNPRTTQWPPLMPIHSVPAPVPMKIASNIGHSRLTSPDKCPPNASCQTLVSVAGMINSAAACDGAIARPSSPMATVGRPRPITPLIMPASTKVPITNSDRANPRFW